MSRLIDADALIEKLKRTSVFECIRNSADKNVFEIIDEQPTAYDVEKVVAKLERHKVCYERVVGQVIVNNYDINLERTDLMNHVIEIVGKGGVK